MAESGERTADSGWAVAGSRKLVAGNCQLATGAPARVGGNTGGWKLKADRKAAPAELAPI